jgi:hypothetical protein
MLKAKHSFREPTTRFFDDGKYVAFYNGGPCDFHFISGKEYSFSLWTPFWVKDTVLPKGSAKIAHICDHHYEVVTNEAPGVRITYWESGETTYEKEGELEIVAHSETPIGSKSEWEIVCKGRRYSARLVEERRLHVLVEINQGNHRIASIKWGTFRTSADFEIDLPVTERIFITHLGQNWWEGEEGDLYDLRLQATRGDRLTEAELQIVDASLLRQFSGLEENFSFLSSEAKEGRSLYLETLRLDLADDAYVRKFWKRNKNKFSREFVRLMEHEVFKY